MTQSELTIDVIRLEIRYYPEAYRSSNIAIPIEKYAWFADKDKLKIWEYINEIQHRRNVISMLDYKDEIIDILTDVDDKVLIIACSSNPDLRIKCSFRNFMIAVVVKEIDLLHLKDDFANKKAIGLNFIYNRSGFVGKLNNNILPHSELTIRNIFSII